MNSPAGYTESGSVESQIFDHVSVCSPSSSPASSVAFSTKQELKSVITPPPSAQSCQPQTTTTTTPESTSPISAECKSLFVEALVDSAAIIIETIWPCATDSTCLIRQAVPLKRFIQETLRRSRTSYSTLQLALYYLVQIQPYIYKQRAINKLIGNTTNNVDNRSENLKLRCGRRAFLAALMIASKYVQDRNYSTRAWSKISGLATKQLCENELLFLQAIGWNAHIKYSIYERWSGVLFECACDNRSLCVKNKVWGERFRTMDADISVNRWPSVTAATAGNDPRSACALTLENVQKLTNFHARSSATYNKRRHEEDDATKLDNKRTKSSHAAMRISNLVNFDSAPALTSPEARIHEWTAVVAASVAAATADNDDDIPHASVSSVPPSVHVQM